jgi:hypothetical protein
MFYYETANDDIIFEPERPLENLQNNNATKNIKTKSASVCQSIMCKTTFILFGCSLLVCISYAFLKLVGKYLC